MWDSGTERYLIHTARYLILKNTALFDRESVSHIDHYLKRPTGTAVSSEAFQYSSHVPF